MNVVTRSPWANSVSRAHTPDGMTKRSSPPRYEKRGRAALIGRQFDDREPGEVLLPVAELPLDGGRPLVGALPDGVVRVLDGQLGELHPLAGDQAPVQDGQLATEHLHRPAIGDDVVHREHEHVVVAGEPHEGRPQQRASGQVERRRRPFEDDPIQLVVRRTGADDGEIDELERHPGRGRDPLERSAVDVGKARPEDLVTIGNGTEAHLERPRMDGAVEPERRRLDVERVAGSEPVEDHRRCWANDSGSSSGWWRGRSHR